MEETGHVCQKRVFVISKFWWVRNLGAISLGGSDSGYLTKLQSDSQPGMQ